MIKHNFDDILNIRVTELQIKEIRKIMRDNPEVYESISHFGRSAIMRQIRLFKDAKLVIEKQQFKDVKKNGN